MSAFCLYKILGIEKDDNSIDESSLMYYNNRAIIMH